MKSPGPGGLRHRSLPGPPVLGRQGPRTRPAAAAVTGTSQPAQDVAPAPGGEAQQRREEFVSERDRKAFRLSAGSRPTRVSCRVLSVVSPCRDRRSVLRDDDGTGDLEQLVDGVRRDRQHAVDRAIPRLVRVETDGVLGARREVGGPVRVGQLPRLGRPQEVVDELRRCLDERVVPREVQQEDISEGSLGRSDLGRSR